MKTILLMCVLALGSVFGCSPKSENTVLPPPVKTNADYEQMAIEAEAARLEDLRKSKAGD
ncbi:hypothetical protein [Rhodopirellula sallentina]|nr:hypothetical protein [Rhodopirellula sallentina]